MTPQDFQDRLLSFKGAAFGLEPVLTQSAWFRPHNRSEDVDRLIWSAPAPIRGPGCRAFCVGKVLDMVVPDAADIERR